MSKNVTVMTLTSGTQIITKVAAEQDDFYLLRNPMEMVIDNSDVHVQRIYLSRFVPFSEDNLVVVYKTAVEAMTICSTRFADMYDNKLEQFVASRSPITDPDKTEVIDGHIDQVTSEDEDDDSVEDYIGDDMEDTVKVTKTYH